MSITCKNCNEPVEGKFCSNCGQSTGTHRLSFHFLLHDLQHGFLHFDKGIIYTVKQLYTRPGHSIREFIEGKRVRHFRPISLVIILATVYGILYHYFHINLLVSEGEEGFSLSEIAVLKSLNEWIATHTAWVELLTIPFYSLGSFIAFRKQGYNFMEHIVLNSFLAGQRLVMLLVTFPLVIYLNGTHYQDFFTSISDFAEFALLVWGYSQFFNNLSKPKSILLSALSYILFFLSFLLVGFVVASIIGL